jgi:hypothetical protein
MFFTLEIAMHFNNKVRKVLFSSFLPLVFLFYGNGVGCLEQTTEHLIQESARLRQRLECAELCLGIVRDLKLENLYDRYLRFVAESDVACPDFQEVDGSMLAMDEFIRFYSEGVASFFFSGNEGNGDDFSLENEIDRCFSVTNMFRIKRFEKSVDSFCLRIDGSRSGRFLNESYADFVRFLTVPGCPLGGIACDYGSSAYREALSDYILSHEAEMATYASQNGTHVLERAVLLGIGNEDLLIDRNLLMHFMRALFTCSYLGPVEGNEDDLREFAGGLTLKSVRALAVLCRGLNS